MSLRRVSRAQFLAAPHAGQYVVEEGQLWYAAGPTLAGACAVGLLDAGVVRRLGELEAAFLAAAPERVDLVDDWTRVQAIEPAALQLGAGTALRAACVRRHALVGPRDLTGAALAGLVARSEPRHEWHLVHTLAEALAWLARSDAREVVEAVLERELGEVAVVRELRRRLADEPLLDAAAAAAALGLGPAALNDALAAAGTTLRAEQLAARLHLAVRLLATSELKLEAVARAGGWRSLARFSEDFLRGTGQRPSAMRARLRGTP